MRGQPGYWPHLDGDGDGIAWQALARALLVDTADLARVLEPVVVVRLQLAVFRVGAERGQLVEEPIVDRHSQDGAAGAGGAQYVARVDDALQDRPHHVGMTTLAT